jgi:hypothetical protein
LFIGKTSAQSPRAAEYLYIKKYKHFATREMESFGIPASVILAQGIFESGCGYSQLAKTSNNHFGIKCHNTWMGDTIQKTDDAENECFRKYASVEASYRDHSIFLRTRKWYTQLFRLALTDYRGWCEGLQQAGYATYEGYAEELIRIIERHQLYRLDGPVQMQPLALFFLQPEIRLRAPGEDVPLPLLARHDLLFSDESHFVIRSLDLHLSMPPEAQALSPVAAAGTGGHGQ